ncbi:TonB-dependent receptor [Cellvibrio sp. pealriver]|uniref:TonB-dependent receptor n=1 Tax=Cellvibrio sp. pealriver TaxID=1622269 RepID=UPI00066FFC20|nr:TonB-dependent receptor [Cellvibrio sp. pealriver]
MVFNKNHKTAQQSIQFKKSMLAMCIMALSAPSFAQNDSAVPEREEVEEMVVTGMRQALSTAQDIKQNADTVVDSITAKDLGSFPDKSVGEALQRVAGISVSRFAAPSDTSHFSAEPAGVVVRGLQQVRSEFNGRDSFSANASRGLSWGDVSPELMSGVDTYKNQTAELIEGGIAGTINLRTRLPFDQEGDLKAVTLNYNYGDLSKEYTPEVSALYSTRWDTAAGEFGVLGNIAMSQIETASQGVQLFRINRFRDTFGADAPSLTYIPDGVYFRDITYDRDRQGVALAAQWKDHDGKYEVALQYNRSEYENSMEEYVVATDMGNASFGQSVFWEVEAGSDKIPLPADGSDPFTFDDRGMFQTGVLTAQHGWWGGSNEESKQFATMASGLPLTNVCFAWNGCTDGPEPVNRGMGILSTTRASASKNMTQDFGVNVKWEPTDTLHAVFDVHYVDSTVDGYDISTDNKSFATAAVDLRGVPSLTLSAPPNQNLSSALWSDPNNYYLANIMDHYEASEGDEFAFKTAFKLDIDSGWVDSLKFGYRFADREQQIRNAGYNWNGVSNTWTSGASASWFNLDSGPNATTGFKGYPDVFRTKTFDAGVGTLATSTGNMEFVFADAKLLQDRKGWASLMSKDALGIPDGFNGWNPICSGKGDRSDEVDGTCFEPADMVDISEVSNAFYVQLHFGGDNLNLFGKPITGNVGVRYVETEVESSGGIKLPQFTDADLKDEPVVSENPAETPPVPYTLGHYLSAADIAYANGANILSSTTVTHHNALPSLNIKYELNDEMLMRLAISRAMARPDIGNMRNYISVSKTAPSISSATDPLWIKDASGNITGAEIVYTADAQNPYLKPIIADQIDLTFEYYFAAVGSFTATAFAKEFKDYIQFSRYNREITNGGITNTVEVRGPVNGEGAKISGLEFAFQRFFDFMPEPFDGFGVQANYTYLKNDGITNTGIKNDTSNPDAVSGQAPDSVKVDRLEGLSDHTANFVLMYEKNDWAARVAYNWRSEYMITAIDCCVAVPIWTEATGTMDGSVKYTFNDNVEVSFQISNILNEQTVLTQQVQDYDKGGLRLPNAWHENDRRYTLGLRLKY